MTIAEVLLQDFDVEMNNTRRTLERVPEGRNDWVPHEKSMPLGKLAMHCATLPMFGLYIVEDDSMDMANPKRPRKPLVFTTRAECVAEFDTASAACRAALAGSSDDHLAASWRFSFGEHLISEGSRLLTFRQMFFNHLVHHVAQLGVYLRLNDIAVPGIYGPSADEPWSPPK